MIKSGILRWTGLVARMEEGKPTGVIQESLGVDGRTILE